MTHPIRKNSIRKLYRRFEEQELLEHGQCLAQLVRAGADELLAEIHDHPLGDEWADFAMKSLEALWAKNKGTLYIAANPVTDKFVKVGLTAGSAEHRMHQLNSAGVIGEYICVQSWDVWDRFTLERKAHKTLKAAGYTQHKEHFAAPWKLVIPIVEEVIHADARAFVAQGFPSPLVVRV